MPQPRKLHDEFFKKAKAEGYVARSVYKLMEIQEKRRILRAGFKVLDLGCAPGSWLQVLGERLDPSRGGCAVGIDLQKVTIELPDHIRTIVGDIYKTDPEVLLAAVGLTPRAIAAGSRFDAVISDMAPNTSGHGDDFLSARLCERVLDLCPALLRPGGNVLMKVLEGEPTPDVIRRTKSMFSEAGTTKPKASRDVSKEIFIWGMGFGLTPVRRDEPGVAAEAPVPRSGKGRPGQPRAGGRGAR